jgi:flagella basal body P-ring formation protein FlgA
MPGIALESGEKGKSIRVQNQSSGKIIKGNILSADSVVVP